jgi:hypothetical protein
MATMLCADSQQTSINGQQLSAHPHPAIHP